MIKNKIGVKSIAFPLAWILWSFIFYKALFLNGRLISMDDVATHLGSISLQHIFVNLPVWLLLFWNLRKKSEDRNYSLSLPKKKAGKIVLGLEVIIYIGLFAYGMSIEANFLQVMYAAIFYLFMVSFLEEYIYRGWMPELLKDVMPKWAVWIVPNLLFTISHYVMLFVDDTGIEGIGISELLMFFVSTMIFGLLMELIKRKTNSLWIVILLHAIYDYYGEIMLWI